MRREDPVLKARMMVLANFLERTNVALARLSKDTDPADFDKSLTEITDDAGATKERMTLLEEGAELQKLNE